MLFWFPVPSKSKETTHEEETEKVIALYELQQCYPLLAVCSALQVHSGIQCRMHTSDIVKSSLLINTLSALIAATVLL